MTKRSIKRNGNTSIKLKQQQRQKETKNLPPSKTTKNKPKNLPPFSRPKPKKGWTKPTPPERLYTYDHKAD